MALLELTDKCLTENDPNIELFDELFKALQALENNSKNNNIVFWFFQYCVLSRLGFRQIFHRQILIKLLCLILISHETPKPFLILLKTMNLTFKQT